MAKGGYGHETKWSKSSPMIQILFQSEESLDTYDGAHVSLSYTRVGRSTLTSEENTFSTGIFITKADFLFRKSAFVCAENPCKGVHMATFKNKRD